MKRYGLRTFWLHSMPPGRPVGDVVDGTLSVTGGSLPYRLYRPATPGPHPIVVYAYRNGWAHRHRRTGLPAIDRSVLNYNRQPPSSASCVTTSWRA
jgi:hypothetical protein